MLTTAEKILSQKAGKTARAGELVVVSVDGVMATDTTAPSALKAFAKMGGQTVWNPDRCALVIDHAAPAPNERIANLHQLMRDFAQAQGIRLFEIGEGICHQVMVEQQYVRPNEVFIGADSHTPTYGALNTFACGVGSTDLAAVMLTGKTWLKVPPTIHIRCTGQLPPHVSAKDLVLFLTGKVGISGATYQAIEFEGEAFAQMSLAARMCVANMAAEMGAKTCFVHPKGLSLPYEFEALYPDEGATYAATYEFEVSDLKPQIAAPESPDNVGDITPHLGQPVQYGFIGTCGNGRLEDLQAAAAVLAGKRLASGTRLVIAPASRAVFLAAMNDGTAQTLIEAGASFITPGCGPCVGSHEGVPADGETVISSANRNFKGRMGNPRAHIYLASPATVAASVLHGYIANS
ncbi:MAG TPA: 3-isopropylmalate dehydratase large subunit [Rhodothermales bacterium]|nr:3-isopropylmalate dehydratase large subunit [Rhodothermales bacterium]